MLKLISALIVVLTCVTVVFSQQHTYLLSITIEPTCLERDGSLHLYKSTVFEAFAAKDTSVWWELDLTSDSLSVDSLERWSYLIEYIPSDTSISPSKRSIALNSDTDIYLDCNFFNGHQEPFSNQLKSGEFIVFYSPEFPSPFSTKTGHETVDYNLLVVERKKRKYYAYYCSGTVRESMFLFGINLNSNYPVSMLAGPSPEQKEISKEELEMVISFERELQENWFKTIDIYQQPPWKVPQFSYTRESNYSLLKVEKELILALKNKLWNSSN